MRDTGQSPKDWGGVYDNYGPLYRAFLDKLDDLVCELLDEAGVSYDRTFTWLYDRDDFYWALVRAARAGRTFENPLAELPGFATLRVVVADESAVTAVEEAILSEFAVDHLRGGFNTGTDTGRYEFVRHGVSLDETRAGLAEWRAYEGLVVDICILTILQNAWEDLDGELPYYDERTYPSEAQQLRVDLVEIMRAADERFRQIWPALEQSEERYAQQIRSGKLDAALDGESLRAYLQASETVARLVRIGIDAGLTPDEEFLPSASLLSGTLWLVDRNDLATLLDLDEFLRSAMDRAPMILADLARTSAENGFAPFAFAYSIVDWLLLVLRRADAATVALLAYNDEIENAVNAVIGNPVTRSSDEP
jgi:hypothetical protein